MGVELDDDSGRHDGEVKGVRLFECAPVSNFDFKRLYQL